MCEVAIIVTFMAVGAFGLLRILRMSVQVSSLLRLVTIVTDVDDG